MLWRACRSAPPARDLMVGQALDARACKASPTSTIAAWRQPVLEYRSTGLNLHVRDLNVAREPAQARHQRGQRIERRVALRLHPRIVHVAVDEQIGAHVCA